MIICTVHGQHHAELFLDFDLPTQLGGDRQAGEGFHQGSIKHSVDDFSSVGHYGMDSRRWWEECIMTKIGRQRSLPGQGSVGSPQGPQ